MPSLSKPIALRRPELVSNRSPWRISRTRILRNGLRQNAAQLRERQDAGHFSRVSERARSDKHWVL